MRIVIFGPGGFGRELIRPLSDVLHRDQSNAQIVFAADTPAGDQIHSDEIADDDLTIIAIGDSAARKQVAERINGKPYTLKAPTSIIGQEVEVGEGAVLCDYTMVTCCARIGTQFQANIYSYVAHDCTIGDHVTFAPRVMCNGNVTIGDGSYIGTGATIRQGITIGEGVTVGMGAVVTKDIPDGVTVIGNPAKPLVRA